MKIKTHRDLELTETTYLYIEIGDISYRLNEDNMGRLVINKSYDSLNINPGAANEIKLS